MFCISSSLLAEITSYVVLIPIVMPRGASGRSVSWVKIWGLDDLIGILKFKIKSLKFRLQIVAKWAEKVSWVLSSTEHLLWLALLESKKRPKKCYHCCVVWCFLKPQWVNSCHYTFLFSVHKNRTIHWQINCLTVAFYALSGVEVMIKLWKKYWCLISDTLFPVKWIPL